MQDLHLVGFTTDRRHLIFSTRRGAKSGSFVVPVDDHLLTAVEELANDPARTEDPDEETVQEPPPPRVEAKLSVREVQARLRSGESSRDVAVDAGVEEDWVERFAPPIRAEQRQIVERALALPMERPRAGNSAKPLGVAVASAMAERDVSFTAEAFARAWSSRLVGQDHWVIEFRFTQRGRKRTVAWTFDTDDGRLTTSDRTASQIGFVAPPEPPPTKASKKTSAKKSPAKKSAAKKPAAKAKKAKKSTKKAGGTRAATKKSAAATRKPASTADDDTAEVQRSTRGDGRPDSAKSTAAVKKAVASTREALEAGPIRRSATAASTPEKQASTASADPDPQTLAELQEGAGSGEPDASPPPAPVADVDVADDIEGGVEPSASDAAADPDVADDQPSAEAADADDDPEDVPDVAPVAVVEEDEPDDDPAPTVEPDDGADDIDEISDAGDPDDDAEDVDDPWARGGDAHDDDQREVAAEPADETEHDDEVDQHDAEDDDAEDHGSPDVEVDVEAEVQTPDEPPSGEVSSGERVRVRRATSRGRTERRPTAQFRSGAAVPARPAATPETTTEAEEGGSWADATSAPSETPSEESRPREPAPRRAVAPTRDARPSRDVDRDVDDSTPPNNGRRPRRTRPLRAR